MDFYPEHYFSGYNASQYLSCYISVSMNDLLMIDMKTVRQPCLSQRVSVALDQQALNEINYMTRKSNINRSALIRDLVEDWCANNRRIESSNSEMIHQINEPNHD